MTPAGDAALAAAAVMPRQACCHLRDRVIPKRSTACPASPHVSSHAGGCTLTRRRPVTSNGEKGYNGKMLNVNLSTGEITVEHFDDAFYRTYLGGYGIGARMALDRIPQGADPLGPDNMLGFFPGALTGTPLFGQRFQVVCKSPLTGGWGDANCGGDFGPTLKHAGWDGIMIFGQAATPKILFIDEDKVELADAGEYWGMDAIDCEDALQAKYGKKATGKNCSVALIGPAGEGLSLISGICKERGRLAARSG